MNSRESNRIISMVRAAPRERDAAFARMLPFSGRFPIGLPILGKISKQSAAEQYTDERYEVMLQLPKRGSSVGKIDTFDDLRQGGNSIGSNVGYFVTAVNLSELLTHRHNVAQDTIVAVYPIPDETSDTGSDILWYFNHEKSEYFRVKVTKDGGADWNPASPTVQASWTYTVKDLAGNTIGTSVSLDHARPLCPIDYGPDNSNGVAFFDGGTLKLFDANEVIHFVDCT